MNRAQCLGFALGHLLFIVAAILVLSLGGCDRPFNPEYRHVEICDGPRAHGWRYLLGLNPRCVTVRDELIFDGGRK